MTIKRKSTTATADPGSAKKPRLDVDGERPMTDKEKRKAARMIRNRSSAQASRDKKREYLESLESTIAHLQSENKDLRDRMINQNTHQIIHGHGGNGGGPFVLPLSPDPSSIAIPDRQMGGTSSENEDEDDTDDDEEDDGHSTMAYDRPRSVSAAPLPLPTSQQASKESAQHSMQYAQALVALTTENATLKTRLKKLEQVVQVLLGMNNGGAVPVTNPTMGLDILSLLGPDQPAQTAGGVWDDRPVDQPSASSFAQRYLPSPTHLSNPVEVQLPTHGQLSARPRTPFDRNLIHLSSFEFPYYREQRSRSSSSSDDDGPRARSRSGPAAGVFLLPCPEGQGGSGTGIQIQGTRGDEEQGGMWVEEGFGMAFPLSPSGGQAGGFGAGDADGDVDFQRRLGDYLADLEFNNQRQSIETFGSNSMSSSLLGLEGMDHKLPELDMSTLFELGLGVDEYGLPFTGDPFPLGLSET